MTINVEVNSTHCNLDEHPVIQLIKERVFEIKPIQLDNCDAHAAFEENDPNLVFIHYKQVDKLQPLLAKHHCPEILDQVPLKPR